MPLGSGTDAEMRMFAQQLFELALLGINHRRRYIENTQAHSASDVDANCIRYNGVGSGCQHPANRQAVSLVGVGSAIRASRLVRMLALSIT